MDAYDWFVQGRELYSSTTLDGNVKAISMFKKALSIDPEFAPAYALLSQATLRDWITFWTLIPKVSYEHVWSNAKQSIALDDSDSVTHSALGYAHLFKGNHDQAHFHLIRALDLNPGDTDALIFTSRYEMLAGNPRQSIERINEANQYNPYGRYSWSLGTAYFVMKNYDEAILNLRAIHSPAPIMTICMATAYAQAGFIKEAKELATNFVAVAEQKLTSNGAQLPQSWTEFVVERWPFKFCQDLDHFLEGLLKAGLPE
jgi:tetratricopeptide (TPR) repeat protein